MKLLNKPLLTSFCTLLFFITTTHSQTTLIPFGSTWKYSATGSMPTNWNTTTFNDAAWLSGAGQLGYGDGDEATCIPSGAATGTLCIPGAGDSKYITYYFRKSLTINPALYTSFDLNVHRDDGIVVYINGVERWANNMPAGRTYATLASAAATDDGDDVITTNLLTSYFTNGTNYIAVEIHQNAATSSDLSFDLELIGNMAPVNLISYGASWKYLDNGTNQGTTWKNVGFNDASWLAGPGKLGYGDAPATTVNYGSDPNNKYITTYFRKSFNITNLSSYSGITLNIIRDDGMVIYVNGAEVARDNLPAGAIAYNTLAPVAISGTDETTPISFSLTTCNFVEGANTIAVEMHQQAANSSDLSMDLELIASPSGGTPTLTRGPYLQVGNQTALTFRWRTSVPCLGRVSVGTLAGTYTTASADESCSTTEHIVRVTGLSADTKYFYRIESTSGTIFQGDGENFFRTLPLPTATRKVRIAAFGDCGRANSAWQDETLTAYRNYLTTNSIDAPDAWLLLGDNAYTAGTDAQYSSNFFGIYGSNILKNHKLYPAPGNHDYGNDPINKPSRSMPYHKNFSVPQNGEAGGVASNKQNYYSYDIGNVHFLSLDSWGVETDNSYMGLATSALKTWLTADLAANTRKFIVAYWHHGAYTKGTHDSDTETELVDIRQNFIGFLESKGVDLIICGHSHVYERGYLMRNFSGQWTTFNPATHAVSTSSGKYNSSSTCPYVYNTSTANHGTVYVTAGSTGAVTGTKAGFNAYGFPFSVADGGIFYFEVEDNRLDAKMLRRDGTVFDNFTIIKDANKVSNQTVQIGTPVILTASWPGNYSWNTTAVSRAITVTPAIAGTTNYTVTDNYGCVTDQFAIVATSTLPVELINYNATFNNGKVNVNWSTASENNSKLFTIERSRNARDFELLGNVTAAGRSSMQLDYHFTDNNPITGTSYYRLSQVDADNKVKRYDLKKIVTTDNRNFNVKQLSAGSGVLTLSVTTANAEKLSLRIIDFSGKEVKAETIQVNAGTRKIETSLLPGSYIWTLRSEHSVPQSQVVVIR